MANPDPEITYEEAKLSRPDVILATGRSDYPNQVNNVLGFPFIFRGALDVRATAINEEMKLAATRALANLAKEDVPDSVCRAYGVERLRFGADYLIPKPFDPRVLLWEAVAVAKAAMDSGVAQEPVDLELYREQLERRLGKAHGIARMMVHKAQGSPKTVVFPEGDHEKILRACHTLVEENIAVPILLGNTEAIHKKIPELGLDLRGVRIVDPATSGMRGRYVQEFVPPQAATRCDVNGGADTDREPQRVCLDDAAHGGRGRTGFRGEPAFPGYDSTGAADCAGERGLAQSVRLLRDDHKERRCLFPR
jgi:malate dehydrogenase (oxaloacetate-decarboxylating)(NADP+)